MKKITKTLLTIVASAFVALQMGALPAAAQQGNGLRVVPPRQELRIERGASDTFDVTLTNISDQPVVVKHFVNDFESDGLSGEPKIITDETVRTSRTIADFLEGIDDVPLAGNEEKTITVSVSVPDSAPAGAYYGLLRFQPVPAEVADSDAPVQFSLNSSVGVLVLLEVPGEFTQSAEVVSVTPQKVVLDENGNVVPGEDVSKGSFFTSTPNQIAIEVRNTGESFVKPFGRVIVKNMFGNEVASYEINNIEPRGNVLPESSRLFTDNVDFGGFGRYTIEANIAFVQGGEVTTVTQTFWVVPVWALIVLAGVLVLIGFAIYMLYRRFTK